MPLESACVRSMRPFLDEDGNLEEFRRPARGEIKVVPCRSKCEEVDRSIFISARQLGLLMAWTGAGAVKPAEE